MSDKYFCESPNDNEEKKIIDDNNDNYYDYDSNMVFYEGRSE